MSMVICPLCGNHVSDDDGSCFVCGGSLLTPPPVRPTTPPPTPSQVQSPVRPPMYQAPIRPAAVQPPQKKKSNPALFIGILAGAFCLLCAFILSVSSSINKKDSESLAEAFSESIETESPIVSETPVDGVEDSSTSSDREEKSENSPVSAYQSSIDTTLNTAFQDCYSMKYNPDSKMITANIWGDGLAQELYLASIGSETYSDNWKNLVEEFQNLSHSIYNSQFDLGLSDCHVSLNILNNLNKDNVLLSSLDGVIVYNVLDDQNKGPSVTAEKAQADTSVEETQEHDPTDSFTLSQKNAIRSAKDYLSFSAFSRLGLIDQLSSEHGDGFSVEDATFAVDYLEQNGLVDWNEQAVKSAQDYLSFSSFSRDGLIDQLSSEHGDMFTHEQAEYAADQVGF